MTPDPDPPQPVYHTFSLAIQGRGSGTNTLVGRLMKSIDNGSNWVNVIEVFDGLNNTPFSYSYEEMDSDTLYRFSLTSSSNDIGLVNPSAEPTSDLGSLVQWVFPGSADYSLSIQSVYVSVTKGVEYDSKDELN